MSAYELSRSSRLAPGPTVTRPGQIPHPSAQALRLVMANFDRRLFESRDICILQLAASAAMQGEEFRCGDRDVRSKLDVQIKHTKIHPAGMLSVVVTW